MQVTITELGSGTRHISIDFKREELINEGKSILRRDFK